MALSLIKVKGVLLGTDDKKRSTIFEKPTAHQQNLLGMRGTTMYDNFWRMVKVSLIDR
jgi:hypothetical protein